MNRKLVEIYEWTQINRDVSVMIKTVGDADDGDGFYGVDVVNERKQSHPIQDVFTRLADAKKRYRQLIKQLNKKERKN